MARRVTGSYVRSVITGQVVQAFIPHPLPPARPALALDLDLREKLARADRAVARLDLAGELVPSLDWFVYAFVRKEAVVPSQIEGTQATLVDLLATEAATRFGDAPEE